MSKLDEDELVGIMNTNVSNQLSLCRAAVTQAQLAYDHVSNELPGMKAELIIVQEQYTTERAKAKDDDETEDRLAAESERTLHYCSESPIGEAVLSVQRLTDAKRNADSACTSTKTSIERFHLLKVEAVLKMDLRINQECERGEAENLAAENANTALNAAVVKSAAAAALDTAHTAAKNAVAQHQQTKQNREDSNFNLETKLKHLKVIVGKSAKAGADLAKSKQELENVHAWLRKFTVPGPGSALPTSSLPEFERSALEELERSALEELESEFFGLDNDYSSNLLFHNSSSTDMVDAHADGLLSPSGIMLNIFEQVQQSEVQEDTQDTQDTHEDLMSILRGFPD